MVSLLVSFRLVPVCFSSFSKKNNSILGNRVAAYSGPLIKSGVTSNIIKYTKTSLILEVILQHVFPAGSGLALESYLTVNYMHKVHWIINAKQVSTAAKK